ncbi:unnamed protein product [Eruca vesicaria subsp. sativa]|uniref:FRIGIDA-like protein n=1 Tax=Eruca vesicaria subsp. sativa TaxID=29727 RepID=A0ABC8JLF2_ERUVS|nr:unnamed protein product [Eruca vesicaria subsp. sativa]
MEKAMSELRLVDLSKHNFKRTLDSLQDNAHSLLLLSIQWKEIESFFDSTKSAFEERAKELEAMEESIKVRTLELERKEKEVGSARESSEAKMSDLEKKEEALCVGGVEKRREEFEVFTKRIESVEEYSNEKVKELEEKAKELELKVKELQQQRREGVRGGERLEFEPLVSLLAKTMGTSVTMPTNCSTLSADYLVKRNEELARVIPYLDPGKLVLDALEVCFKDYLNKDFGEADDSVVKSCVVLLEKLTQMKLRITREMRQEASQLGVDWMVKAKTNPNNDSLVLGCLLFVATYGWASGTTREMLFNLLKRFLLYEQAPKLFRRLGLQGYVSGVVETLKKNGEYLATLRFICEFQSSHLCQGWRPRAVMQELLQSLKRVARLSHETGNVMEAAQKAKWEKSKADANMALDCIREKKAESLFSDYALTLLSALAKGDSAPRATEPVHRSCEKGQNTANAVENSKADSVIPYEQKNEAKRQRLTEPITPLQNSKTVNQVKVVSAPSGEKVEESGVNHQQPDAKATYPLSTETEPKILSGSINADTLRKLLEKQPPKESDIFNAIKCTSDPAKLVLDTSMALCPKTPEEGFEFKLLVTSDSCSLLLDQLKKLPPQNEHPMKADAKKLAVHWKEKVSKSKTDELEVVCFLKFLGIFGIVSEFKAHDLLGLLDSSYWQTVSPDLCQFLGLDSAVPGFIKKLIKTGHRLKSVDYIYSFGMVHRFQPVSAIINDSLRITKESAEKSYSDAKNESAAQVAAIERQIKSLRAAIRCILRHKLESDFQLGDLEGQIKSLSKLRRTTLSDGSATKPGSTVKQPQTVIPPTSAELGAVTSNTPLEPSTTAASSSSVSEPGSTSIMKRGQKRSFSDNKESSVQVTSSPSNHSNGHGGGHSLNERQSDPVDHDNRGVTETSNSDKNQSQLSQPEGPP